MWSFFRGGRGRGLEVFISDPVAVEIEQKYRTSSNVACTGRDRPSGKPPCGHVGVSATPSSGPLFLAQLCLSPFIHHSTGLERWGGASAVMLLPKEANGAQQPWKAVMGRLQWPHRRRWRANVVSDIGTWWASSASHHALFLHTPPRALLVW